MNDEILPKDAELYRRVEEIVHYLWDPIGVGGIPQARDEYYGYMTAIYGRVQAGDLDELVECMKRFATENMGLLFEKERTVEAASAMLAWKEFVSENT